jgi:hypothetical protein
MKSIHILLLAVALVPATGIAAAPPAPLPAWDQLSPAQRDIVIAPIRERWNTNPDARARMFEQAQRWRQLTPQQRNRARRGMWKWERMDPEQRDAVRALFHRMRHMTPDQRQVLRDRWRAMTPEQRRDWVRSNRGPDD